MKKCLIAAAAIIALVAIASEASAHGPGVRFVPVQQTRFVPARGFVPNNRPIVIQQTTRGLLGRPRTTTTVVR